MVCRRAVTIRSHLICPRPTAASASGPATSPLRRHLRARASHFRCTPALLRHSSKASVTACTRISPPARGSGSAAADARLSPIRMSSRSVCFVVGARPNFMKAAPVYRALAEVEPDLRLLLVHTGQHYDAEMSAVFVAELDLPPPDVLLGIGSGTHGEQTAKALVGVERVLLDQRPSLVVVAGDVNSTLAAALAASKLQIPVAHIESGLRSFDEGMPEEANRRLTDHLSQILLAHSDAAVANLLQEKNVPDRIHLIGNT